MRKPLLLAALLLAACGLAIPDDDHQRLSLVLPAGDAERGREAFDELSCGACHALGGEPAPKGVLSANPGPTLGPGHAARGSGELATAIVAPSHEVAPEVRARLEGRLSPMGDFTDVLTVRQLADLVAWIQAQE